MKEKVVDFSDWIGRTTTRKDEITPRMVELFRCTLGDHCFDGGEVPPGLHWCLAPEVEKAHKLGEDGHPKRGGFLPDLPYARRMWAGGWVEFHDDFGVGNKVERKSRLDDIKFKSGNSGNLCFVAITHEFSVDGSLKIRERHDVVYRECVTAPPLLEPIKNSDATHRWHVDTDSIMLFRYSALTFNGHRIHYDLPYAVEVEGHDGLLVHGPLQATLMLNLASSIFGKLPRYMSYRGVRPLVCGNPVMIDANPTDDYLETCVRSADGNITMKAAVKL